MTVGNMRKMGVQRLKWRFTATGKRAARHLARRWRGRGVLTERAEECFRGRSSDQVKQACDPQRQTPEERSRTLDK
jgi:hypothetical protein